MYKSTQTVKEVVSATDKTSGAGKSCHRFYDRSAKSYVFCLETPLSKLILPPDGASLALQSPYLLFQLLIPHNRQLSLIFKILDCSGHKKRILFTTASIEHMVNSQNAKMHLNKIKKNVWLNLCFDLVAIVDYCFPASNFKQLISIEVTSFCKLRKIVSLSHPVWDPTCMEGLPLPRNIEFPLGVEFFNQNYGQYNIEDSLSADKIPTVQDRLPMQTDSIRHEPRTASPLERDVTSKLSLIRTNNSAPSRRIYLTSQRQPKHPSMSPLTTPKLANHPKTFKVNTRKIIKPNLPPRPDSGISTNPSTISHLPAEVSLKLPNTSIDQISKVSSGIPTPSSNNYRCNTEQSNIYSKFETFVPDSPRESVEETITEMIEADNEPAVFDSPYVRKPDVNYLPRPSYYEEAMKNIMQHRPFTPPFQDLDGLNRLELGKGAGIERFKVV